MSAKKTHELFLIEANTIHQNKYFYVSQYTRRCDNIKIKCPYHGVFIQNASDHLSGYGCRQCAIDKNKKLTTKSKNVFIREATLIHINKNYDYSKVIYINNMTNVTIICPIHGEFLQLPGNHLKGHGCSTCGNKISTKATRKTTEMFIKESKSINQHFGKDYDYSKTVYLNGNGKVTITCPIHGDFTQRAQAHVSGHGCPKCASSYGESIVSSWLNQNKISYIQHYSFDGCCNKRLLIFDFYIPTLNTVIEYQGEQHYHVIAWMGGIEKFNYTKKCDDIKRKFCKDNDIRLIEIKYTIDDDAIFKTLHLLHSLDHTRPTCI